MQMGGGDSRGHVQALDGVRGLAILLVLTYHGYLNDFGWVGVELFFVLSGFLITRGLLAEAGLPWGAYLQRFYLRRALRIFPIYYLYIGLIALLAVLVPGMALFHPDARWVWLTALTYTMNYAGLFTLFRLFGHFWSLALEEQFYLVWPYVAKGGRRALPWIAGSLIVLCPLLRWLAPAVMTRLGVPAAQHAYFIYLLPIAHTDGFAVGALLAALPRTVLPRPGAWLAGATAALLAVGAAAHHAQAHAWAGFTHTLGFPGGLAQGGQYIYGYTLLFLVAGLLVLAVQHDGPLARLFALRPLAYIGKISYGIYIYHILVRELLKAARPDLAVHPRQLTLLLAVLAIAIAAASYHAIEAPLLAVKARVGAGKAPTRRRSGKLCHIFHEPPPSGRNPGAEAEKGGCRDPRPAFSTIRSSGTWRRSPLPYRCIPCATCPRRTFSAP
jgi:peptidoglycan/LPS O-acetylase OafA/YrhL